MFEKESISRTIIVFIMPFIVLYAIYIQLNGEVSPGGGFQAGVIFATAVIGFDLVFGNDHLHGIISTSLLVICSALGVFIYAFVGICGLLFGGNYLDYNVIHSSPVTGQHIGIFCIEIGVGITVSAVMCLIYSLLREN